MRRRLLIGVGKVEPMRKLVLPIALTIGVAGAAAIAFGQANAVFQANAFRTPRGTVIRFLIAGGANTQAAIIRRWTIGRPSTTTATAPPTGTRLGSLDFALGNDAPRNHRTVTLRRIRLLPGGSYLIAEQSGARVVLNIRDRRHFVSVALPRHALNPKLTLRRSGRRTLHFADCPLLRFTGAVTLPGGRTIRNSDSITPERLMRAGLC